MMGTDEGDQEDYHPFMVTSSATDSFEGECVSPHQVWGVDYT